MKKIVCLVLSVVMLLSCFAVVATASTQSGNLYPEVAKNEIAIPVKPNVGASLDGFTERTSADGAYTFEFNKATTWFFWVLKVPAYTGEVNYLVMDVKCDMVTATTMNFVNYLHYTDGATPIPGGNTAASAGDMRRGYLLNRGADKTGTGADTCSSNLLAEWTTVYIPLNIPEGKVLSSIAMYPLASNGSVDQNGSSLSYRNVRLTNLRPDVTITPNNESGLTVKAGNAETVMSKTVFEGKNCYELAAVGEEGSKKNSMTMAIEGFNKFNAYVKNYNYILVNCYYTGERGTAPGYVGVYSADYQGWSGWWQMNAHKAGTTEPSTTTRLSGLDVEQGKWVTLVIPICETNIYATKDSEKVLYHATNPERTEFNNFYVDMNGNGISTADGGSVYVSSITFSQSATPIVDAPAQEIEYKGAQIKTGDTNAIRMIATLDKDLNLDNYSKVGFRVQITHGTNDPVVREYSASDIYTSVMAAGEVVTAAEFDAQYLAVFVLEGIPTGISASIRVTPFLVEKDGTVDTGVFANVKINADNTITTFF